MEGLSFDILFSSDFLVRTGLLDDLRWALESGLNGEPYSVSVLSITRD